MIMLRNNVTTAIAGLILLGGASPGWAAEADNAQEAQMQADDELTAAVASQTLSEQDAQALERGLADHPEDHVARAKLLGYYSRRSYESQPAAEAKRRHILWLIEHAPTAGITGSSFARLDQTIDGDGYGKGKALWLAQVAAQPRNTTILGNAANYLSLHDSTEAEKLWLQAQALEPANPKWPEQLAGLYTRGMIGLELPAAAGKRQELAKRALEANESALRLTHGDNDRFYRLADVAKAALEAGDTKKAAAYAEELVAKAKDYKDDWNYGNAVHHGHLVLGQIALSTGDVAKAKMHLIEAGKTPGSPQLNSFGPNMSLARELLAKGERDAVIEYLQLCAKFWSLDRGRLKQWQAAIEKGQTPEFGGNLLY